MKRIKDLEYMDLPRLSSDLATIPHSQIEGPSVSIEPGNTHGGNVGDSIDIEIWKQREAPDMSNKGERTPATSLSALDLTSELAGIFLRAYLPIHYNFFYRYNYHISRVLIEPNG